MPHDFTVGFRRSGLSLTVLRLDDVPLAFFRTPGSRLKSGTISRLILSAVVVGLYSETATAHGFGQRYDLPVPLPLWVVGAGATILLAFVLVVVFARETKGSFRYPRINLFRWAAFRLLAHPSHMESSRNLVLASVHEVPIALMNPRSDPTPFSGMY